MFGGFAGRKACSGHAQGDRMMSAIRRVAGAGAVAATAVFALVLTVNGQSKIACDPDNGGIKLPEGFCALVVAERPRPARHLAVAPNGDLYVALRAAAGADSRRPAAASSRCATPTATASSKSGSSSARAARPASRLRNGYLYLAHPKTIERFKMTAGPAEAGRRRRDRRHGSAARLAAAQRQGHRVRRQGQRCTSTSARRPTPASSRIVSPARRVRIPARFSRSTAASGSSTRTSWIRRRTRARSSRPACASCRPSPGTTARSTS